MGATHLKVLRVPDRNSGIFPKPHRPTYLSPLVSDSSEIMSLVRDLYKQKKFGPAENFLKKLLAEDPFNTEAIALLLGIYSRTGHMSKAQMLFQESRIFADREVYTAYIDFCCHNKKSYEAYNYEGVEILQEAKSKGAATPEAFAMLITYFGYLGKGFIAESIFEGSAGQRDASIYSAFIFSCCRCREPWKGERALDRAQNENILDPQMFKNLVKHYSDCKMIWDARRIFDWAIARDQVDTELCSLMVQGYLYGEHNVQGAREIFDIAMQRGIATSDLCSLMETGYMDSKMHEAAEEIFHIAENSGMAGQELALAVMRGYTCAGKKQQALDFYSANRELLALNREARWYHSLAEKQAEKEAPSSVNDNPAASTS